jgi:hypothetical protein
MKNLNNNTYIDEPFDCDIKITTSKKNLELFDIKFEKYLKFNFEKINFLTERYKKFAFFDFIENDNIYSIGDTNKLYL